MDSANLEAKDAGRVVGAHMDPDRVASPTGLDILPSVAEFVSVHDRDPGMLEDAPPPPEVLAPPPSPKPRKSRSRRRGGSSSVEVTQRVRAPSGRGLASERPGSPYVGPAIRSKHPQTGDPQSGHPQTVDPQNVHPQTGNPQTVHPQTSYQQKSDRRILDPQSDHPQKVHPQNSSDNPQWNTRSVHILANPPATASGSSDSGTHPQYTLDHRHGSTTPQLAISRREQQTPQNRTLTLVKFSLSTRGWGCLSFMHSFWVNFYIKNCKIWFQ